MTGISISKERRPLAMFEYADHGRFVIAKIMQHGDKFSVTEKNADEWLAHIKQEALGGRYDASWVAQFELEYAAFLKGNELPREGTPIRTWGAITREQGTRLIAMNITTVEDLAASPDSSLGNIGLDGRYLRDLAKSTMASKTEEGAMNAKKIADLEQSDRDNKETIKRMEGMIAELKAQLPQRETLTVPEKKKAA